MSRVSPLFFLTQNTCSGTGDLEENFDVSFIFKVNTEWTPQKRIRKRCYADHDKLARMGLRSDTRRFKRKEVKVFPAFFADYSSLRILDHDGFRLPKQKYQNLFVMAIKTLTSLIHFANNQICSLYINSYFCREE